MKKIVFLGLILLMLLLLTPATYAQGNNYVDIKLGLFQPNDETSGLKDFDTGGNFEVVFGHKFNPNLAIEWGIGYYSSEYSEEGYVCYGYYCYPGKLELTASAIPITVTLKGVAPLSPQVELYGGAGLGLYLATLEADLTVYGIGSVASASENDSPLGFHIVGGGTFYLSDTMGLGMEIKWFTVEPDFGLGGVEYGGRVFNAGLRFKF